MKKEKLGSEYAFGNISQSSEKEYPGMSKRFYAACAAMQGLLSNSRITELFEKAGTKVDQERTAIVAASYKIADELLTQENE